MSLTDRIKRQETLQREAREKAQASQADVKRLSELADELQRRIDRQKRKRQGAPDPERERRADKIEELEADTDRVLDKLAEAKTDKEAAAKARRKHAARAERLRRKHQEIQADATGKLSPNFHVAEFHCRDGTPVPIAAIPALRALCQQVLEPQRARFGSVHVNSGYRTLSYNAAIGGASNSIHIYSAHPDAVAADHICASGSARNWFDNTAGKADGRGLYSSFHHADNRNRIGWPDAVWSG